MTVTAQPSAPLRPLWVTAGIASVFAALYTILATDPPLIVSAFLGVAPVVSAALWLRRDARLQRVEVVFDWGLFVLLVWPVLIPWYAIHTRGRGGWSLVGRLFAAILAPFLAAVVTAVAWALLAPLPNG